LLSGLLELTRVIALSAEVESGRTKESFKTLIARLRKRGLACSARNPLARSRLRRAIALVDRLFPDGGNCYRRVLLEIAMDSGAAKEPILFGLSAGGGPGSGHACLASDAVRLDGYDAIFVV